MSNNQFDWVPIYKELANALIPYSYRRGDLIEKIKQIFESTGIKMPMLEKNNQLVDIDPFTVFGLFNKGILKENRDSILRGFKDLLGLESPLPSSYDGIPVLNVLNATYYRFINERDQDDIDDLWKLFISALKYAQEPTDKNKASFSEFFSRAVKMKGNGNAKITMGLYWIAPETFMNLDSRNRWYIYEAKKLPAEFVQTLPNVPDRLSAAVYFDITDKMKAFLQTDESPFGNFMELSHEAWRYSEEDNERVKREKEAAQAQEKGDGLADGNVRTIHYWIIAPGSGAHKWNEFYQAGIIGIGWDEMGDLSRYASKDEMQAKMRESCVVCGIEETIKRAPIGSTIEWNGDKLIVYTDQNIHKVYQFAF